MPTATDPESLTDLGDTGRALIARPGPCPACRGRGAVPAWQCRRCAFVGRVSRNAGLPCLAAQWHDPASLVGADVFPCGHPLALWSIEAGEADCPACGGSGTVPVWKTADAWARIDRREAGQKKQEASEAARVLSEHGKAVGFSKYQIRRMLRFLAPTCEAHSRRTGQPCRNRVILGKVRCAYHGGLSTGPKTAEGRARIRESNRRRSVSRKDGSGQQRKEIAHAR